MRVYLGATLDDLDSSDGLIARPARAVTTSLRQALGTDADEEMAEYAALVLAAEDSLRLLADGAPLRRVVAAADVPDTAATPGEELARVHVPDLTWTDVVSFHVDSGEAHVRDLLERAVAGEAQAISAVGEEDLLWYDVTERETLLGER
ncbi:hypothetical protein IM660_13615 [Ruania alkalisoli]|uniref:Uncharacterized protein n=1 Tax=Ruania alkalisoli TaxID=2779775 RepID=A0A7M1SQ83_9MICO|nr:hypothetical protein [Ruania alkalisoli]QOR69700.1 hypothetical protein IM660_13615 [Ruania alkalisoli]